MLLVVLEIAVDLPVRDVTLVLPPLHVFDLEELVDERRSKLLAKQRVGFESVERGAQALRQDTHAELDELVDRRRVVVDVLRLAWIELAIDPVETCGDDRGRSNVRVAAAVGQAEL